MEGQPDVTRREFIHSSASGATALGIAAGALSAPLTARAAGLNGRLGISFIGPGGRGMEGHVRPLAKLRANGAPIELVAVNDVYVHNAQKAADYISESVWAFVPSFVAGTTGIDCEALIKAAQKECENANDGIAAMIEGSCGMDHFVEAAIAADGRGH